MQWGELLEIDWIYFNVFLGEQVLDNLFTAGKGSPVERSAEFGVSEVDIELFVVEIEEGADFVSLCSEVKQAHFEIVGDVKIGFVFLQQFEDCDVTAICCIVGCCVAFLIWLVEEDTGVIFDFRNGVVFAFQGFSIVLEVEFENFGLVVVGGVMKYCVFVVVADGGQVQGEFLAFQEELDFFEASVGEHEFLFIFVLRHNYYTLNQKIQLIEQIRKREII